MHSTIETARRVSRRVLRRLPRRLLADQRGNVAIIFALFLIPVLGITASAFDYGRASKVRTQLQNAADMATDHASRMLDQTDDVIRRTVRQDLAINLPPHLKDVAFSIAIPAERTSISLQMATKVATSLMRIAGIDSLDVGIASNARRPAAPSAPVPPAEEPALDSPAGEVATAAQEITRRLDAAGIDVPPDAVRQIEQQLRLIEQAARRGQLPPELARALENLQSR